MPSAPPGGPAAARGGDASGGSTDWKTTVVRGLVMYFGIQVLSRGVQHYMKPAGQSAAPSVLDNAQSQQGGGANPSAVTAAIGTQGSSDTQPVSRSAGPASAPLISLQQSTTSTPLWGLDQPLDIYVVLTSGSAPTPEELASQYSPLVPGSAPLPPLEDVISLASARGIQYRGDGMSAPAIGLAPTSQLPVIKWEEVTLGSAAMKKGLSADMRITTPDEVIRNNGSIWADILLFTHGEDIKKAWPLGRSRKMLTRLLPPRKHHEARRLIGGKSKGADEPAEAAAEESSAADVVVDKRPVPFWHRNLTLAIPEQAPGSDIPLGSLPPPLLQWVHPVRDPDGRVLNYENSNPNRIMNYPVVFPNTFWDLREDTNPINSTTPALPLHISIYTTSWFKFQMLAAMSDSFEKQAGVGGSELDLIKNTLLTTSPYYLIFTLLVTLLHSLFEFLAFSSDVTHWRKRENLIGVSVGSILTNIVTQTIILLYLFDSSEDTSWMILGSQAVGIVVESWKLTKALTVNIVPSAPGSLIPYRLDVKDKHVLSPEEIETQKYDRLAFKIVAAFVIPLLGAYTVYSAIYQEHRGWWNFIISTLVSFVYSFGFVSLIPQLIVNYKMKSVAGVAPKTLVYKILTTFIDDVFAFAIKMPLLHRLATLRDDVVFVVWLVQAFVLYPTDNKRVNEFGQVVDPTKRKELEEKEKEESEGTVETKKDQ